MSVSIETKSQTRTAGQGYEMKTLWEKLILL